MISLARSAVLLMFLLALGCGRRDDGAPGTPLPVRGSVRGGGVGVPSSAPSAVPVAAAPTSASGGRAAPSEDWRSIGRPADEGPTEPTGVAPPVEAPEVAARDYSTELSAAFGSPASCFDFARISTFGESLRVNVSVTVMPSGRVNRATASGSGFTPEEVACLEERAMNTSIRGPVDGAPRTISARIEYAIETTPNAAP
jgi:hypothetical protein